ncbi:MAG TPA: Arm DNA-binding domain-containing protein [Caulobacteraceae bacterium]
MLTDVALKNLKTREKMYKVADRDGMYVAVTPSGVLTFRYDYRIGRRRETLTLGKYGPDGITLAQARERCMAARKMVAEGLSPAIEKQRTKRRLAVARTFGDVAGAWFKEARMADSTRAMRRAVYNRDIHPVWKKRHLSEIGPEDLRALCEKITFALLSATLLLRPNGLARGPQRVEWQV